MAWGLRGPPQTPPGSLPETKTPKNVVGIPGDQAETSWCQARGTRELFFFFFSLIK